MEYLSEILFGESEGEEGLELGIKEECDFEEVEGRKLRQYLNKVRDRKWGKLREVVRRKGGDNKNAVFEARK
ncbi:hypothetical protein ES705_03238 [subsurface metagenome]